MARIVLRMIKSAARSAYRTEEAPLPRLGSKVKAIGTPVACPACRHPNPGINIWCERCRTPLDWNPPTRVTPGRVGLPRRRRAFTLPRLTMPAVPSPRVRLPALTVPRPRMPHVPRIALVVAVILAVLLIVPLAYLLLPAGRAAVDQQTAASHLPSTNGTTAVDTPQAAAIPGVEAKTHLRYHAGTCDASTPCLTVVSETMGKDAAAVVFSTGVRRRGNALVTSTAAAAGGSSSVRSAGYRVS